MDCKSVSGTCNNIEWVTFVWVIWVWVIFVWVILSEWYWVSDVIFEWMILSEWFWVRDICVSDIELVIRVSNSSVSHFEWVIFEWMIWVWEEEEENAAGCKLNNKNPRIECGENANNNLDSKFDDIQDWTWQSLCEKHLKSNENAPCTAPNFAAIPGRCGRSLWFKCEKFSRQKHPSIWEIEHTCCAFLLLVIRVNVQKHRVFHCFAHLSIAIVF